MPEKDQSKSEEPPGCCGFSSLIKYTLFGYLLSLAAAFALDRFGFQRAGLGQWLVRTLSGEGESIFEAFFSLRQRLALRKYSLAEAYAWGKFLGLTAPWIIDFISRWLKVDVYGVTGFYLPYFYAMSDQIGAAVVGFMFFLQRDKIFLKALKNYLHNPVMLAGLSVIFLAPVGLFAARIAGFSPATQIRTASETIAANLCWVPVLVGWILERREKK